MLLIIFAKLCWFKVSDGDEFSNDIESLPKKKVHKSNNFQTYFKVRVDLI